MQSRGGLEWQLPSGQSVQHERNCLVRRKRFGDHAAHAQFRAGANPGQRVTPFGRRVLHGNFKVAFHCVRQTLARKLPAVAASLHLISTDSMRKPSSRCRQMSRGSKSCAAITLSRMDPNASPAASRISFRRADVDDETAKDECVLPTRGTRGSCARRPACRARQAGRGLRSR